jgi:hypothetical protein
MDTFERWRGGNAVSSARAVSAAQQRAADARVRETQAIAELDSARKSYNHAVNERDRSRQEQAATHNEEEGRRWTPSVQDYLRSRSRRSFSLENDLERAPNENRDQALNQMRDKRREMEAAVGSGRRRANLVREYNQSIDNYAESVRQDSRARREASAGNGGNDRAARDSQQSNAADRHADSQDRDSRSWQDRVRDLMDSRN